MILRKEREISQSGAYGTTCHTQQRPEENRLTCQTIPA
jgi:hypothetical protein